MEVPPKTKQFNKFNHKALLAFSIINIILALISCVLMVIKWSLFDVSELTLDFRLQL